MTYILTDRIKVGISACNFGAKVRWNHRGWDRVAELDRDWAFFQWVPVCPEINSGFGVTRDPIRLVGGTGDDFWAHEAKMKNRAGHDVSDEIRAGLTATMDILERSGVEAFFFMEGSPSCGVYRTTLKNKRLGKPPGAFGALLLKRDWFLIPAEDLNSPVKWWDWRRRLHAFVWLKRQELTEKAQLFEIWSNFKFLCQEVDDRRAREIGHELAQMPKRFSQKFAESWRHDVLLLLRKPSNVRRIAGVMQKHFSHYAKHIAGPDAALTAPRQDESRRAFVARLHEIEKRAALDGFTFKGTPVMFRGRR